MTNKLVPGSCFCGAVQFTIELPTLFCGHCHCSMCRRPHGAAFVTWTAVPPKQLKINAGDEQITRFESGPPKGVRSFCSKCGSHLFCQVEEDVIDIAMAALNGPIDRLPEEHYYYDSRADWVEINDNLPKLGGTDGRTTLVKHFSVSPLEKIDPQIFISTAEIDSKLIYNRSGNQ